MKKVMSTVVSAVMLLSILLSSSAFAAAKAASAPADKVELKMLFVGDAPADQDLVWDEINKLALKDLNCTVTIKNLSWSDYTKQYPLVLASGEPMDLVYSAEWLDYFGLARKGAFKEITMQDIQRYMPNTFKSQPKATYNQAKVDGKLFMIPQYQYEFNQHRLIMARGDLMKKYGLKDISSIASFEKYADAVAKNEKGILPLAVEGDNTDIANIFFNQANRYITFGPCSLFGVRYVGGKFDYKNVVNVLNTKEYANFCSLMKKWADKGYWSKNAASGTTRMTDNFTAGKSATDMWNIGSLLTDQTTVNTKNPSWSPVICDVIKTPYAQVAKATNNGVSISITSKHYDRALMLLDKLKFDEKYNKLSMLGMEGVHYKAVGSNSYTPLPANTKFPIYGTSMWGWVTEKFRMTAPNQDKKYTDYINTYKKQVVYALTDNFVFDDTKVKSEVAAITNVCNVYRVILDLGETSNVQKTIKEYTSKLNAAGLQKVTQEFNRQYSAFLKANDIK